MQTRQFLKTMVEIVTHVTQSMAATHRADIDILSARLATMASLPWAKAPLAVGALSDAIKMLQAERQLQGVSLRDLQTTTGVSRSALSMLESQQNANPSIATLEKIAAALGKKLILAMVEGNGQQDGAAEDIALPQQAAASSDMSAPC